MFPSTVLVVERASISLPMTSNITVDEILFIEAGESGINSRTIITLSLDFVNDGRLRDGFLEYLAAAAASSSSSSRIELKSLDIEREQLFSFVNVNE